WIEDMARVLDILRRRALAGALPGQPFASVLNQAFSCRRAKLPKLGIADPPEIRFHRLHRLPPAVFSARAPPQPFGIHRLPTGRVHAIGDVTYGDFALRPPRKQRLE